MMKLLLTDKTINNSTRFRGAFFLLKQEELPFVDDCAVLGSLEDCCFNFNFIMVASSKELGFELGLYREILL